MFRSSAITVCDDFEVEIKVSLDEQKNPVSVQEALSKKDTRLATLSSLSLLMEYMPELSDIIDKNIKLIFSLDDFAPLFLKILPILKAMGISVILPKALRKIFTPKLNLNLKSKDKVSEDRVSFLNLEELLSFNWQIAIGDKNISISEFKKLLREYKGLVKLADQYILLDEKEMEALLKQIDKLPDHLSHADLMQAVLAGELDDANVQIDEQIAKLLQKLSDYEPVLIPDNLNATLRPYQERGFNWMVQNMDIGFGSILADDMGLGKTIQVISVILHCKNQGLLSDQKVLIVAPTSLLSNWQKEIEKFAPELEVLIYHGSERNFKGSYDILITSYGLLRRDKVKFKQEWFMLVIDEAQNIKNANTEQTKSIKSIKAKYKIAMSGTPVENRLLEYWSIFDFSNKGYLGKIPQFKKRFAKPIESDRDKDVLERFKKVTRPFLLRRLKSDKSIIKDLPDKIQNTRYCHLTPEQTAIYQEIVNKTMRAIEDSEGIERKGLVLKLINSLKQICNHPSQFMKKKNCLYRAIWEVADA